MIIVLLGAGWYPHKSYKWKDAGKLLDYGFENYAYEWLGKETWELSALPVTDGMENEAALKTDAGKFSYLLKDGEKIQCRVTCAKELQAPVTENMVVGTITYELDGNVIEQFQIYTAANVERADFWKKLKRRLFE